MLFRSELMDELLDKSSSVPFSQKKMIDVEQMREYIDSIRLNLRRIQHARAPVKRTFEKNRVRASRNRLALVVLSVPGVMQRAV